MIYFSSAIWFDVSFADLSDYDGGPVSKKADRLQENCPSMIASETASSCVVDTTMSFLL
jgi:hypothetical protein